MLMNAYSIFDNKALNYGAPWFQINDGVAIRVFADLANDLNTNVGRHPSDYILYAVGFYDDAKGELIPVSPLRHVRDAISLVELPSNPLFPNTDNRLTTK